MTNATKKTDGWSSVRPHLSTWDKSALLALVKDLYETAEVNRDFIQARCQADETGGETLERYQRKIEEQLEQMTDGIGWGFHDFVADVVRRLEVELADP